MILKPSIFIFSLLFSIISFTQEPVYFNNIYNPVNTYASGRGIIQIDNYYYGIFGTWESPDYWYKLGVFKMDLSGNIINWHIIGENGFDYFAGSIGGTLIQTIDGNLAFACQIGAPGPTIGTLVKLNLELDTIWKRDYHIEEQYTMTIKVEQTTDGGYVVVGQVYPGTGYYFDALIIKTDSLGNVLWYNTFGVNSNASEYGTDVIETPDGGYLIGGMKDIEAIDHSLDAMLIKTDNLGNEEWTKYYGNPWVDDDMAFVAMADDGNYLVATVYGEWIIAPDARTGRIYLMKIDVNGDTIWAKKIGSKMYSTYLKNLRHTQDGNLIVSGFFIDSTDNYIYKGFMYKFSQVGDSIWMRDYSHFNSQYDWNLFYDASPTTDNGYIAIGQARPDQGGSTNKMWIMKVDSMGCDTAGCATGVFVEELSPTGGGWGEEPGIYPNPAKDRITILPPLFQSKEGKNFRLRVYNSQGIKVKEIHFPKGKESVEIDVSNYSNGFYYLQYILSDQITKTVKFIKN